VPLRYTIYVTICYFTCSFQCKINTKLNNQQYRISFVHLHYMRYSHIWNADYKAELPLAQYISFVHLRNFPYVLLAHFNVNYKAKLSSSTFLFCAYAVLSAAQTFETQIDSLPLQCSLLLAHFICAPTLRYVLVAHLKCKLLTTKIS